MIRLQMNEYAAEDCKYIDDLRKQGVPDNIIQIGYDTLQIQRKKEKRHDTQRLRRKVKGNRQHTNTAG